jgi:8-hydroxy-5-deazaflavin:NADPH oxidoreductase
MVQRMEIGVLGATGPAGRGLAARLVTIGHDVIAGSRDPARSAKTVASLQERWGDRLATLRPGTNADAAGARDLVVLATTWEGAVPTASAHADALAGKVVVCIANGLERIDDEFRAVLPEQGSLAEAVQRVAPDAKVVAAFQHVPASAFLALDRPLEGDVIVCSDDEHARVVVRRLIDELPGLRAFDGGSLANAVGVEAFAAVLLSVNLRHRGKGALRLTGFDDPPAG